MRGFGLLLFEELHFMLGSELSQADFVARLSRLSRMDCITVYVYCYLLIHSQPPGERSTEVELLYIE